MLATQELDYNVSIMCNEVLADLFYILEQLCYILLIH